MTKSLGSVTREQATRIREFVADRGVDAIACTASQIADGVNAGQWIGMGCERQGRSFTACLFTTEPLVYPTQGKAAQGAMALLAGILTGVDEVIDKEG